MPSDRASRLFGFLEKRKRHVLLSVAVLTGLAAAGLWVIPYDHSLDCMLPRGGETRRSMRILRETNLSGKVVLWLERLDGSMTRAEFISEIDRLASGLTPPLVLEARTGPGRGNMMENVRFFLDRAPLLMGPEDVAGLAELLTPEAVAARLRRVYLQLLKPEGSFMSGMFRRDPLGISRVVGEKLARLSSDFGYNVTVVDGHFLSPDERHAIVILETPVAVTDSAGSRRLLAYLAERVAGLPPSVGAEVICAHQHTVSNEKTVKRDIAVTCSVAAAAFLVLFFLSFRDPRVVVVFLVPAFSLPPALVISGAALGGLATVIIGMGSVVAGIVVDYSIHVYVAVMKRGRAAAGVLATVRPVTLGAVTTMAAFAAFFVSRVDGYRQLACIAILSILVSLLYAFLVLPVLVAGRVGSPRGSALVAHVCALGRSRLVLPLFLTAVALGAVMACRISLDSEMSRLDGTEASILKAEREFFTTWGRRGVGQALVVVERSDYEDASRVAERIHEEYVRETGRRDLVSFCSIWPSAGTRAENARRWNEFWTRERTDEIRGLLRTKGSPYGFSDEAFAPFFDGLGAEPADGAEPVGNALFEALKDRFVQSRGDRWLVTSFLPDEEDQVSAVARIARSHAGSIVISRRRLGAELSQTVSREVTAVSVAAALFIVVVTLVFLGNTRAACVALVPAATGVIWMLAVVVLSGHSLNIANLIAGVIVIGLCIDYGIFMTHACGRDLDAGTDVAVSLSAATTLIGAGALLFARHPALFSVGLTLSGGVFAGYLAAMIAVPALCERWKVGKE